MSSLSSSSSSRRRGSPPPRPPGPTGYHNLPSSLQNRLARVISPRDMQSLGRSGRSGRDAADSVHANRAAMAESFVSNTRLGGIMTSRSFPQRVVAAVAMAEAALKLETDQQLRRAGFTANLYENHEYNPPVSYGRHQDRRDVHGIEIQSHLNRTAHGREFSVILMSPHLATQVKIRGGLQTHGGLPAVTVYASYDDEEDSRSSLVGAGQLAHILVLLRRAGYAVLTGRVRSPFDSGHRLPYFPT